MLFILQLLLLLLLLLLLWLFWWRWRFSFPQGAPFSPRRGSPRATRLTLALALSLVHALGPLHLCALARHLVLLQGLAGEGLPEPAGWRGSRPKPSPRTRPRAGPRRVAST